MRLWLARNMRIAFAMLLLAACAANAELKLATPLDGGQPGIGSAPLAPPADCEAAPDRSERRIGAGTVAIRGKLTQSSRIDTALVSQARAGDPQAAWRVALALFSGDCTAQNYGQVLGFIEMAAQSGHACATGALGLMMVRGWGIGRDLLQARELLERSALAGCRRAYYWSWLADELAARPQTRERALLQLMKGADAGDGHALNALAVVREIDGQRGDARMLYARAASAGNTTARTNLARLARYFSKSSEKPGVALLTRRADAGDAQAQYQLARRFHQGDGISANYVQALKWYQRAADKGNPAAREMLTLIQARLGNGDAPDKAFSDLAMVDLKTDELNLQRGITQPVEDIDPFIGAS